MANLCVLGWFGHRNAGDDRIAEVLIERLPDCHLTFLPFLPLPHEIVNYFDGVVLTAGNWHPRNRLALEFHRWSRHIHVPIVALGLGVESMPAELLAGSKALVDRAELLWVRDEHSRHLLGDDDSIRLGPDLSWASPLPPPADGSRRGMALNLRDWRPAFQPESWIAEARRTERQIEPWPLAPGDAKVLAPIFPGLNQPWRRDVPWRVELTVGMRLHSLIFSAQAGTPSLGLSYDPKCSRFLAELGHPEWALPIDQPQILGAVVADLWPDLDRHRHHIEAATASWPEHARSLIAEVRGVFAAGRRRESLVGRGLRFLGRRLLRAGFSYDRTQVRR